MDRNIAFKIISNHVRVDGKPISFRPRRLQAGHPQKSRKVECTGTFSTNVELLNRLGHHLSFRTAMDVGTEIAPLMFSGHFFSV